MTVTKHTVSFEAKEYQNDPNPYKNRLASFIAAGQKLGFVLKGSGNAPVALSGDAPQSPNLAEECRGWKENKPAATPSEKMSAVRRAELMLPPK